MKKDTKSKMIFSELRKHQKEVFDLGSAFDDFINYTTQEFNFPKKADLDPSLGGAVRIGKTAIAMWLASSSSFLASALPARDRRQFLEAITIAAKFIDNSMARSPSQKKLTAIIKSQPFTESGYGYKHDEGEDDEDEDEDDEGDDEVNTQF